MRPLFGALLLAACSTSTTTDTTDQSTTDAVDSNAAETGDTSDTDTDVTWATGLIDTDTGDDDMTDDAIGATPLDGTWTGTFWIRQFRVTPLNNPRCIDGTIEITVDGNAERHLIGTLSCSTWDPNTAGAVLVDPRYGEATGALFGTLDPQDFTKAVVDITVSEAIMGSAGFLAIEAPIEGDTMTIVKEESQTLPVVGKEGFRIEATVTKQSE